MSHALAEVGERPSTGHNRIEPTGRSALPPVLYVATPLLVLAYSPSPGAETGVKVPETVCETVVKPALPVLKAVVFPTHRVPVLPSRHALRPPWTRSQPISGALSLDLGWL